MAQHGALQIEALFFEVSEHLFDPHTTTIIAHRQTGIWQVADQAPGFFFTDLPVDQNRNWIDRLLGQVGFGNPNPLPRPLHKGVQGLPVRLFIAPNRGIAFLTQHIEPRPIPAVKTAKNKVTTDDSAPITVFA